MAERWYEFEERATFTRPVYVKAASVKEARTRMTEAVADYPPSHPDLAFNLRGRIAADQAYVDALAVEDRRDPVAPPRFQNDRKDTDG